MVPMLPIWRDCGAFGRLMLVSILTVSGRS